MVFSPVTETYYESYGFLHSLYVLLYLLFFPLFMFLLYYKFSKIRKIERSRIMLISLWFAIFVMLWVLFQIILPMQGIFVLEREVVIFLIPLLFCFWYGHNRYAFSDIRISLWKIFIFTFSVLFSYVIVYYLNFHIQRLPDIYHRFWNISWNTYIFEFFVWLLIYICISKFLLLYILPHSKDDVIVNWLSSLKEKIPRLTSKQSLDTFLSQYFQQNFHIWHIRVIDNRDECHTEISKYFDSGISRDVFINDTFFIENHKNKFENYKKILDIHKDIYLILPGYDTNWSLKILFEVWRKPLSNVFSREEIIALKSFVVFLQWHLQYISLYKEIQDLSINLDKKVDEKTIEFNNLLNKQKEFIAYVWHEIKNPITNTLFLTDSIKDDLKWKIDTEVQEDIWILYDELVKVSKLVKYIFSAEKFDLDKVKLYKTQVKLGKFIASELDIFNYNFENLSVESKLDEWLIHEIDEIQFRQVIHNLVNNSIKFIASDSPKIFVSLSKIKGNINLVFEDNWIWFSDTDLDTVFSKYTTGTWEATWLGMGLYLCKKIINLHDWEIKVWRSKLLWWAKFTIVL